MADLGVDVKGMEELEAGLRKTAEGLGGPEMRAWMIDSTARLMRDAKILATPSVNTGNLRDKMPFEVVQRDNVIMGVVGSKIKYAPFVEDDTRPHWPPRRPIIYWAMRKLQLRGTELRAAVRGIQRKIAHHGTKGQKMFEKSLDKNLRHIMESLGHTIGRIISR